MEIKNVSLLISAQNGQQLEIPLDVWQVDIIVQMLGLKVDTSNLKEYKMSSKTHVDERMELYYESLRRKYRDQG